MKKHLTWLTLTVLLLTSFLLLCSCTKEEEKTIDNLIFELNDEGNAYKVVGMPDHIVVPAIYQGIPITEIAENAFKNQDQLKSITLSEGIVSIGDYAFGDCDSLTSITIPDGVTSIGRNTFSYCTSLTSITIPDSVTSIGVSAFFGCTSLSYNTYDNARYLGNDNNPYMVLVKASDKNITSCNIHEDTKFICNIAFSGCTSLTSITIPDSVTSIGSSAFSDCASLTYNTYDNARYLGNDNNPYMVLVEASDENITNCNIHEDTKFICNIAFFYCDSLTSITIPDGVTSIGDGAFFYCDSLTSITIPDSVTSIGSSAFLGCDSRTSITYNGTKAEWEAIEKASDWDSYTDNYTIHCTDGDIEVTA